MSGPSPLGIFLVAIPGLESALAKEAKEAGFTVTRCWTDAQAWFGVFLASG